MVLMAKSNESTSSIEIILYENKVLNIFDPFNEDCHNTPECSPFPYILSAKPD